MKWRSWIWEAWELISPMLIVIPVLALYLIVVVDGWLQKFCDDRITKP